MSKKKLTKNQSKSYYLKVKKRDTIYVWGMNYDTIIDAASIKKAYEDNATAKYNKSYYNNKLLEGKGKPGADCSGMHFKASGYDCTAQRYFERCPEKGTMDSLPISDIVLLFKGNSEIVAKIAKETDPEKLQKLYEKAGVVHTGAYLGNGICIHMKSSTSNCVLESVDIHGWNLWGKADFIDYTTELKKTKPYWTRDMKTNVKGVDVKFAQTLLNKLGYDCGAVDGIFGKKTKAATIAFQKAKKLETDGIIGPKTAKKLGFKFLT